LRLRPIELVFVDQHPLLLVRPHYLRVFSHNDCLLSSEGERPAAAGFLRHPSPWLKPAAFCRFPVI
jgi:hypothetical protein